MKKISNEELIDNLQAMCEKLGKVVAKEDLRLSKGSKYSINAYKRAFGGFNKALMAAGITPNQHRGLTKEDYLADLQRIYKLLGHTPSMKEFDKHSKTNSWRTVYNVFGTWTKALLAAGIPIETSNNVSKQDVLDALQTWYDQNDQDTGCLEYWKIRKARARREFPYSPNSISSKFQLPWEEIMQQINPEYTTKNPFICRGTFEGKDGNIYLSSIEKEVGDLLYEFQKHGKIKTYKYEALVCPNKTWTCDFLIDGRLWLEVDGMRNNRSDPYNSGENEKIAYYDEHNLPYEVVSYRNANISSTPSNLIAQLT